MRFILIIVLLVVTRSIGAAQIMFDRITVNDGLSQSAVQSFCQDKYGYLWVATRDGLNRYDGKSFTIYRHDDLDASTLANNQVWKIRTDTDGNVWAATAAGLSQYHYDKNVFSNYRYDSAYTFSYVNSLLFVDSLIYIAPDEGLIIFNSNTKQYITTDLSKKLANTNIVQMTQDQSGNLFFASTAGLLYFEDNTLDTLIESDVGHFLAVEISADGQILAGTDERVYASNDGKNFTHVLTIPTKRSHRSDFLFLDNTIWYGVRGHGIYVMDSTFKIIEILDHHMEENESLSSNLINEMFISKDKNIWVGTDGLGINQFNAYKTNIKNFINNPNNPHSLGDNYVTSIYSEDDNEIMIGTLAGLDRFNLNENKKVNYPFVDHPSSSKNNKIYQDSGGQLWFGAEGGVYKYNDGVVKKVPNSPPTIEIVELDQDRLLLGTATGNLIVMNKNTNQQKILFPVLLGGLEIRCLLVEDNFLWVGTNQNLFPIKLDGNNFDYQADIDVPKNVKFVKRDSFGNLWVGTWANGLYQFDSTTMHFVKSDVSQQLLSQTIYGMLEDGANNLWFSTNHGISCYVKSTGEMITFDASQGLQSNEFNTEAYFKSPNGKMYFGGVNGLSTFFPKALLDIPKVDPPLITKLYINNEPLPEAQWFNNQIALELPYNQRNIAFDITSITFTSPDRMRYQYQLENFNEEPISTSQQYINFTNLDPGEYTLRLKSTDNLGRWQTEFTTFRFNILKPYWQKIGFQLLFGMIGISMGVGVWRWRISSLKRQKFELEQIVQQRTEELKEKNARIAHQAEELHTYNDNLEKLVLERTNELLVQNKKLSDYAFLNAHNLRAPVANIKGIVDLLNSDLTLEDKIEFITLLNDEVDRVDQVLHNIKERLEKDDLLEEED